MATLTHDQMLKFRDEVHRINKLLKALDLISRGRKATDVAEELGIRLARVQKLHKQKPYIRVMLTPRKVIILRATGDYDTLTMMKKLMEMPLRYSRPFIETVSKPAPRSIDVLDRSLDDGLLSRREYDFLYRNVQLLSTRGATVRDATPNSLNDWTE